MYGSIFVLLGFAEAGVLLGRETFLIDRVDPAERTTYVAFANTAMDIIVEVEAKAKERAELKLRREIRGKC